MWALLAPSARGCWGGAAGYTAYYRAKFAPVVVHGIAVGAPRVHGSAVAGPLSLDLAWRSTGPPGVLSLFQNLEATVVRTPAGWRVAQGGPLDPEAPFIPAPRPPDRNRRR